MVDLSHLVAEMLTNVIIAPGCFPITRCTWRADRTKRSKVCSLMAYLAVLYGRWEALATANVQSYVGGFSTHTNPKMSLHISFFSFLFFQHVMSQYFRTCTSTADRSHAHGVE